MAYGSVLCDALHRVTRPTFASLEYGPRKLPKCERTNSNTSFCGMNRSEISISFLPVKVESWC